MSKKDLLVRKLRPREGGVDDLEKNCDDGMSLRRHPDPDCLSVQTEDQSPWGEKSF
jgi:hypothetical protein